MITQEDRPITHNWTTNGESSIQNDTVIQDDTVSAGEVNALLAQYEVGNITPELVPYLAAAAAELAQIACFESRVPTADAPVSLLRLIAKVAITQPDAGGPHTGRLRDQLL